MTTPPRIKTLLSQRQTLLLALLGVVFVSGVLLLVFGVRHEIDSRRFARTVRRANTVPKLQQLLQTHSDRRSELLDDARIRLVELLLQQKNYPAAYDELETLIRRSSDPVMVAQARYTQANIQMITGNLPAALQRFEELAAAESIDLQIRIQAAATGAELSARMNDPDLTKRFTALLKTLTGETEESE